MELELTKTFFSQFRNQQQPPPKPPAPEIGFGRWNWDLLAVFGLFVGKLCCSSGIINTRRSRCKGKLSLPFTLRFCCQTNVSVVTSLPPSAVSAGILSAVSACLSSVIPICFCLFKLYSSRNKQLFLPVSAHFLLVSAHFCSFLPCFCLFMLISFQIHCKWVSCICLFLPCQF